MSGFNPDLLASLRGGASTVCRCWRVIRRDGRVFGFTDHDLPLTFDGTDFAASDGLSARAFEHSTGLSVDNSEAVGVLSDAGVTEADILAGRFDGAEVEAWLVDWTDTGARQVVFAGTLGEIERSGGAFRAELRGLTEALNQPQGRTYQAPCPAVLGDATCRVDLDALGLAVAATVETITDGRLLGPGDLDGFAPRFFERGRLVVLSGAASGAMRIVKRDSVTETGREIELWDSIGPGLAPGDSVRLEAGCDKRAETCRVKFDNLLNFQGFPHLPGEDWLMAYPRRGGGTSA
ncbi:DUF2163 domain-containing protein [Palleronia pelagia]|uniref:Bacteriophage phiJL001 Gp84 C-terminal domain-containing protein n=1 Tax=Palleronia pelagia TaxID=387096 RepID=A0A1H8I5R1_9RHOB|nr:DUF2163 domain-containing protein [Palleronia pelagia]SEN63178.1 phage conserved hypothetical protein BR0599 [Palleronia pelagia]